MGNRSCKVSLRLTPFQEQVLHEMSIALDTSYSMLIRTIIGDWLSKNEDYINRIIDRKKEHAQNQ